MPRKYLLSWDKTHKRWIKTIDGVKHYFEKADRKADLIAYKKSLEQYKQLIGEASSLSAVQPTTKRRSTTTKYKYPKSSMAGVVERYFAHHKARFESGIITAATLTGKGYSLEYFIDHFVRRKAYKMNSIGLLNEQRFAGFNTHLRRRYNNEELSFQTAKLHQNNVAQMIKWAWRQKLLNELPRNLEDPDLKWHNRTRSKPRKEVEVFTPEQLQTIFNSAFDTQRWCDLRIFMLLGLNCGFSPSEIGSLRWTDFVIQDSNIYIERRRPKTGVRGKWILWSETIYWMDKHFGKSWTNNLTNDGVLFLTQVGNSLASSNQTGSEDFVSYNNINVKRQTAIQRRWQRLCKSALEDPNDYLSFKYLRKTGASFLANMDINNSTRVAQTYLSHSAASVADRHYLQHNFDNQNEAIIEMGVAFGFHTKQQ
jgi:integrase